MAWDARPLARRGFSLVELLDSFPYMRSTDPRDRIYGLLGIRKRGTWEDDVPIDYSISVIKLYTRALEILLDQHQDSIRTKRIKIAKLLQNSLDINPSDPKIEKNTARVLMTSFQDSVPFKDSTIESLDSLACIAYTSTVQENCSGSNTESQFLFNWSGRFAEYDVMIFYSK